MFRIGCHYHHQRLPCHGKAGRGNRSQYISVFYQKSKRRQSKGFRCERYSCISAVCCGAWHRADSAHAPYTINACGKDERVQEFARETMADDLRRLEEIPDCKYNFHPGSHVQQGAEVGIEKIAGVLNEIMWQEQKTTVLLETMAGKGTEVGRNFEELQEILSRVKYPEKVGVCLDTCHVFDGGYDISGHLEEVLEEFDRMIGLDKLCAIHLNDSKNVLGSHKDRHECLGAGNLTMDAIVRIINHPALKKLPFYLETPNDLEGYAREIAMLKAARKD